MKKNFLLALFLLSIFTYFSSHTVYAQFFITDNAMKEELHSVSGKQATLNTADLNQSIDDSQSLQEKPPDPTFIYFLAAFFAIPLVAGVIIFFATRF